nr:PREDICTED: ejaculatory bulb-specific protein 3-like [Linepithema humile]
MIYLYKEMNRSNVQYKNWIFGARVSIKIGRMVQLSCIVFIGIALVFVFAEELYTSQYDYIDVDIILANNKLRNQYYKCFMETAPCKTADMKFFREVFSESLQTQCKKCTEKQKIILEHIIEWYTENRPDEWNVLIRKHLRDLAKKNAQ